MGETRSGKYGRWGAILFEYILQTIPVDQREDYRERFLVEFGRYSDKLRRRGEPRNEGCVLELEDIDEFDVTCPEHLARWFKEGQHLKYLKPTARREREGFLEGMAKDLNSK